MTECTFSQVLRICNYLKAAADITIKPSVRNYLLKKIDALKTDYYYDSDLAWLEMTDSKMDLIIGPNEVNDDQLYGLKTSYEAYVLLKDLKRTEVLDQFKSMLPELQKQIPCEEQYKTFVPGDESDIYAYDAIYCAGHANAGIKLIALNLPYNEEGQAKAGTRTALLRNIMMEKFNRVVNPQLGIHSARDVMFAVMCSPVGTYSGAKSLSPGNAVISRNYDRASTFGSGCYKLGANYAQSLHAYNIAHNTGYRELLFLDSATKTTIEEFGSSNFFAIKGNTYITPRSGSVLPSITNNSLRKVAADMGLNVEVRPIKVEELAEFDEVNSCGTAVVITPICSIDDKPQLECEEASRHYTFGSPDKCGAVSEKLYNRIIGIQKGLEEDTHNWCLFID